MQDVRVGMRSLMRVPMLTLTIVVTVGIGIGATAAIFSAINAAMLRPLPYGEPERLVRIYTDTPPFKFRFSAVDYLAFTQQQTRFEQSATYTDRAVSFSNGEIAEVLRTRVVSWGFFSLLGVQPMLGRDFSEPDGRPGTPPVVLASHAFWQQRLGGRADAIGRPIRPPAPTTLNSMMPRQRPLDRRSLFPDPHSRAAGAQGPSSLVIRGFPKSGRTCAGVYSQDRALFRSGFVLPDERSTGGGFLKTNLVVISRDRGLSLRQSAVWLIACANGLEPLIAR